MNIGKIIYLNCGERYEFMIDHRSYTHNLSVVKLKPEKKRRGHGFESHSDLNFFQALIPQLLKLCV